MRIRWLIVSSMFSLSILLAGGCGIFGDKKDEAALEAEKATADSAAKARKEGEKILDNILKGLEKSDYSTFAKSFANEMREAFPEKGFGEFAEKSFKKKYNGPYESRQLLGDLSVGELTVLLWKARFKNFKNDVLIRMDVGELDGKILVFRLLIQ